MGRTYTLRRKIDLITPSPRIPTMQQVRKGKRSVFSKLRDTQQVRFLWGGCTTRGARCSCCTSILPILTSTVIHLSKLQERKARKVSGVKSKYKREARKRRRT